jgi:hypothetical protein
MQTTLGLTITLLACHSLEGQQANDLWQVYQATLRKAKYVDLTHTVTPTIPVWKGFGPSKFTPTVNPENGQPCWPDPKKVDELKVEFCPIMRSRTNEEKSIQ